MKIFFRNLLPTLEILTSSLVFVYVLQLLDGWVGLLHFSSYFFSFAGATFLLVGIVIRIWATVAFSRHQVTVLQLSAPETLVQDGPYAYSRHPLFVGIFLIVLGLAVIFGSLSMTALSVVLLIFADWWIRNKEEPSLLKKFGETYANYQHKTRRWI